MAHIIIVAQRRWLTHLFISWKLLTEPVRWTEFFGIRVMRVDPPGSAIVGQRVYGESGPGFMHFRVTIDYTEIDLAVERLG